VEEEGEMWEKAGEEGVVGARAMCGREGERCAGAGEMEGDASACTDLRSRSTSSPLNNPYSCCVPFLNAPMMFCTRSSMSNAPPPTLP
jgi:hypothetical protein